MIKISVGLIIFKFNTKLQFEIRSAKITMLKTLKIKANKPNRILQCLMDIVQKQII